MTQLTDELIRGQLQGGESWLKVEELKLRVAEESAEYPASTR